MGIEKNVLITKSVQTQRSNRKNTDQEQSEPDIYKIRRRIRCHGGVGILCRPVASAVFSICRYRENGTIGSPFAD